MPVLTEQPPRTRAKGPAGPAASRYQASAYPGRVAPPASARRGAAAGQPPAGPAKSRRPSRSRAETRGGPGLGDRQTTIALIALAGLLVVVGWHTVSGAKKPHSRPATQGVLGDVATGPKANPSGSVSAAVAADFGATARQSPAGSVVEVKGPSARAVLAGYCDARKDAELVPVGVIETTPPSPRARIGLFRDMSQWDQPVRAIKIWRDPRTREWVASGAAGAPILEQKPPLQAPPPPELARLAAERSDGSLKSMAEVADPAAEQLSRGDGDPSPPAP